MNSKQRLKSLKEHLEKFRCASGAELAKKFSLSLRQLLNYLRGINALTSYSHRRSFYTLREIAHFDKQHIWKCPRKSALFSDLGSLEALVEWHVRNSPGGLTCRELSEITKIRTDPHIRRISRKRGLIRQMFNGEFVYFYKANEKIHQRQLAQRKALSTTGPEQDEVDVASLQQDLQIALALLNHPKESLASIVSLLRKKGHRVTQEDLVDFFHRYEVKKN